MTRAGYAALIILGVVSLIGLIVCSVKQQRQIGRPSKAPAGRDPKEPTVVGEPVRFRCADMRFVTCKASGDIRTDFADLPYTKRELAYLLADQLMDQGAIRYSRSGDTVRAELRAVLPEAEA